jgi:pyrroloquinoline quinone biosynthesis protein D
MSSMTEDRTPRLAPTFRFQWEEAQQCHVILYPEGMVKLSPSAGEILKRVDGKRSIAEIVSDLSTQFPGVDLGPDVNKFLEAAHDNGWIRFN